MSNTRIYLRKMTRELTKTVLSTYQDISLFSQGSKHYSVPVDM